MPSPTILEADLDAPKTQAAVLHLLDMYAREPVGGGKPLSPFVRENLIQGLKSHPTTRVFLAVLEDEPVGIAVCFLGFSTFAAKPLLNIHDLAVEPGFRGRGIGKALLEAVERAALDLGCCKLTLEVVENNHLAKKAYLGFGFSQGQMSDGTGGMLFYSKKI